MAEYYDSETLYDNPQLKKLNEVLDNITDEELDRRVYEIECQCEGLDPTHPYSPKRLKKIKRRNKWKYKIWPFIRNTFCWLFMLLCAYNSGYVVAEGLPWYVGAFHMLGAIAWLNLFLSCKFGSDYILK